jgi:integrase
MKGHLRERSPGNWAIVLDVGERDPRTGKKKRKWHSFKGTKREAQNECSRLITALSVGSYVEPTKQTVADFLNEWLTFIRPSVAPKTHERYTEICRKGLAPLMGDVTLAKLKTDRIDSGFTKALTVNRARAGKPLAPRTVHHYRRVLIKAMNQAVTWERLAKNPARATTPPKVERKRMLAYDATQTAALLAAMRPTRMFIPTLLAVMCGMRRGEILALRWRNVELGDNRRQIAIVESAEQTKEGVRYKEPKSGRARTIALSLTVLNELKAHRTRQAEEQLRLGLRPDGDNRFHDLRHTHASQMLAAGVHPKVASERLGHSTIGITLDLYSHVMPGMQADAAEQVDAAIRKAINAGPQGK